MIDDYDESSGWMFLLVPAHPGFPGQIPQSRKTVVCVCVYVSLQVVLVDKTEQLVGYVCVWLDRNIWTKLPLT